jgi:hypothetical protein
MQVLESIWDVAEKQGIKTASFIGQVQIQRTVLVFIKLMMVPYLIRLE